MKNKKPSPALKGRHFQRESDSQNVLIGRCLRDQFHDWLCAFDAD